MLYQNDNQSGAPASNDINNLMREKKAEVDK